MGPPRIPSIAHVVLDLPPSCIEFAPAGPLQNYFIVGTYHLTSSDDPKGRDGGEGNEPEAVQQVRSGSLMLFRLHEGHELYDNFYLLSFQYQNLLSYARIMDIWRMVLCSIYSVVWGGGWISSV